jgi:transcription initiation factor TFIIF subunit beta
MSDITAKKDDLSSKNTSFIEVENSERRVWLVKMPDFVYNKLIDLEDGGMEVGTVRIYPSGPDAPARVMIRLDPGGPCGNVPSEYELKISKAQQQMYMFSEDENNEALSIEGKVEQECQMKPVLSQGYRQMLYSRNQEANKSSRSVQYVDAFASPVGLGLPQYVNEHILIERFNKRGSSDLRRERLPHEELLNLLFHQFERQPHLSLQQLIELTHQPVQYLKEVLSEIAIYNTRGPFKNFYELRSEYIKRE